MVMNDMDSDDSDVEVVNIPPEGSDEDEGNDEGTGVVDVNDVPGSVEVHFQRAAKDNTAQTAATKNAVWIEARLCGATRSRNTLDGRSRLKRRLKTARKSLLISGTARLWKFLKRFSRQKCSI